MENNRSVVFKFGKNLCSEKNAADGASLLCGAFGSMRRVNDGLPFAGLRGMIDGNISFFNDLAAFGTFPDLMAYFETGHIFCDFPRTGRVSMRNSLDKFDLAGLRNTCV